MAVRLVVLLLKRALVQLLQAERADKVFWMELAEHSRDTPARYRLVAAGTQRATLRVIVRLAIRLPLVVEKRSSIKRLPAILQRWTHS